MASDVSELKQRELLRVRWAAAVETESWWGRCVTDDPEGEVDLGRFVSVPPEEEGYRLIGRLRGGQESNLLSVGALSLLQLISQAWRDRVGEEGSKEIVFLSVASLYRDSAVQRDLIASGANAAQISSHQAGMAIDFDPGGYYLGEERTPISRSSPGFNGRYMELLLVILEQLYFDGACNFVKEKSFKESVDEIAGYVSCYHVCVSPEYVELFSNSGQ